MPNDSEKGPFGEPVKEAASKADSHSHKRFFKFAAVMAVFFVVALVLTAVSGVFNPIAAWQQAQDQRRIMREAREREEFEKNDTYGGNTPEETYQLFLHALEKEDIELASKYFVKDKQEEIKKRLRAIHQNGKWQLMYDDVSGRASKVEYERATETWYEIKVRGSSGGLIAVFRVEQNVFSNLWKLTEFF